MRAPLSQALALAMPARCRICRGASQGGLCEPCLQRFSSDRPRCLGCGLGLPQEAQAQRACGGCLHTPTAWRQAVCAEDYAFPWNQLVARFKFHGDAALASLLAARLSAALQRTRSGLDVDLVLPIPLSAQRLQERGFNQAWELSRRLARRFGLSTSPDLLQRPIDTAHQAALTLQERTRNLQGAFMLVPGRRHEVLGRRVALVDDVMTTGATFREAARALHAAGAASVDVWAVARTP